MADALAKAMEIAARLSGNVLVCSDVKNPALIFVSLTPSILVKGGLGYESSLGKRNIGEVGGEISDRY